ncbi:MAG: ATP synthase subunit I [Clostridia bacterium]|nr:ATP synthase subunit I [Clostridia bacterium]
MKKIDPTVKKETLYILVFTVILSALMQSVFLIIGKWEAELLYGNLVGIAAAVGNFFLMGLSVQRALEKDEKDAKGYMRFSQSLRFLGLFSVAVVAYLVPFLNPVTLVLTYLFPRVAIAFRPLFNKRSGGDGGE